MISILKNMYIDKLPDIVNKYNNAYHRAMKMKLNDVKPSTYSDFGVNNNNNNNNNNKNRDPTIKGGDYVRISKYKNIFAKVYTPNWSEKAFVIKKTENAMPGT